MRTLVTGATGFIGRHLCSALKQGGFDVCQHSHADGDVASASLDYDDVNHVFHLAGLTFVPESWHKPSEYCRVNVLGTYNVLDLCRRHSAALTYVSSYVYGRPQSLPVSESHPRAAANPYSLSKLMAEDACLFYSENFGVRTTVIRPFNIYGLGQDRRFLVPTVVNEATRGDGDNPISVADDRPRRDFLHVSDLVRFLVLTVEPGVSGVYNAGSGAATSVRELIEAVIANVGPRRIISRGEMRKNEILEVRADISKAQQELGWNPKISLDVGLKELVLAAQGDGL